jgi:1-acyl-sn-glycerol-3-phosphate acyltransferase
MSFGEPMYFEGDPTDLEHLRDVADTIMRAIGQLSGQEYVDTYAPKKVRLGKVEEEE